LMDRMLGNRPGFFTIYAMSASGSPPIEKNSMPLLSCGNVSQLICFPPSLSALTTKSLNAGCVQIRTRWPWPWSNFAIGMKGCTSPRDPQIWIAIFNLGGLRLLVFSLMNSSTRAVLPLLGFAHSAGRHTAASFWTFSNQYLNPFVFL
jgi:hypothetical protein